MPAALRSLLPAPARLLVPIVLVALFAGLLTAGRPAPASAGEAAYRALSDLPTSVPASSPGLEARAVELAGELRAVPSASGELCPTDRLRVSWAVPTSSARHGAHLVPVGPAPDADTQSVNGVVRCDGSSYGYMGFEAWREARAWRVAAVPFVAEQDEAAQRLPLTSAAHTVTPVTLPSADAFTGPIEAYAPNEPQRTCDPAAKAGATALAELLTGAHPGTRDLGIGRDCVTGGQSEHMEGRAFDWGVLAERPEEKAAADAFVELLLAPDAVGNPHALARRMGVMYVIWDGRIWSSQRAETGWRPYTGASPHTDHVHLSLSWDGALGRTSFWTETPEPPVTEPAAPEAGDTTPEDADVAPPAPDGPVADGRLLFTAAPGAAASA